MNHSENGRASRLSVGMARTGLVLFAIFSVPVAAYSQQDIPTPSSENRIVPGCQAAMCEEETAFVAALDALLQHDVACGNRPPVVLRTLHLSPFTDFGDAVAERRVRREGLPTSPPVARMDDFGINPFRRYWEEIQIVDASQIRRGAVAQDACLYVFSPVTWLAEDKVRIIIGESRESPAHIAQRFVFLHKEDEKWVPIRIETGMQSAGIN